MEGTLWLRMCLHVSPCASVCLRARVGPLGVFFPRLLAILDALWPILTSILRSKSHDGSQVAEKYFREAPEDPSGPLFSCRKTGFRTGNATILAKERFGSQVAKICSQEAF